MAQKKEARCALRKQKNRPDVPKKQNTEKRKKPTRSTENKEHRKTQKQTDMMCLRNKCTGNRKCHKNNSRREKRYLTNIQTKFNRFRFMKLGLATQTSKNHKKKRKPQKNKSHAKKNEIHTTETEETKITKHNK